MSVVISMLLPVKEEYSSNVPMSIRATRIRYTGVSLYAYRGGVPLIYEGDQRALPRIWKGCLAQKYPNGECKGLSWERVSGERGDRGRFHRLCGWRHTRLRKESVGVARTGLPPPPLSATIMESCARHARDRVNLLYLKTPAFARKRWRVLCSKSAG